MSQFNAVWFWDSGYTLNETTKHIISFYDDSQQKPSLVAFRPSPNHAHCNSFNTTSSHGIQQVHFVGTDYKTNLKLWYVTVDSVDGNQKMRSVVAYGDARFPEGTVIDFATAARNGITYSESVGFVKWFIKDSKLQQIFVSGEARRMGVSTKLFAAADLVIVSDTKWNGSFLHGGDVTTADGERLRQAWSQSVRVTPRIGEAKSG